MILHNTRQIIAYSIKKLSGQRVTIRKNDQGLLVLRTRHVHPHKSEGFVLKTRRQRKRKSRALIMGGAALSLLIVLGLNLRGRGDHPRHGPD